jgi:hypothetical protein
MSPDEDRRMKCYRKGWLSKKGFLVRNWKKRLFLLCYDMLHYYSSESDKASKRGHVEINWSTTIVIPDRDDESNNYPFNICTADRVLELSVDSDENRNIWIDAIQSVIYMHGDIDAAAEWESHLKDSITFEDYSEVVQSKTSKAIGLIRSNLSDGLAHITEDYLDHDPCSDSFDEYDEGGANDSDEESIAALNFLQSPPEEYRCDCQAAFMLPHHKKRCIYRAAIFPLTRLHSNKRSSISKHADFLHKVDCYSFPVVVVLFCLVAWSLRGKIGFAPISI